MFDKFGWIENGKSSTQRLGVLAFGAMLVATSTVADVVELGAQQQVDCRTAVNGDILDVVGSGNRPVDLERTVQVKRPGPDAADGSMCIIRGNSDLATVKLDPGPALELPLGSVVLGADDLLTLYWDRRRRTWYAPPLERASTDWKAVLDLSGLSERDVHDLLAYDDGGGERIYICGWNELDAVVLAYDPHGGTVETLFSIPGSVSPGLRCRNIDVFQGDIYAAIGSKFSKVPGAADVYRWDGSALERVLDTDDGDMYALAVSLDGSTLYAGGGTVFGDREPNGSAKLWSTTDGVSWVLNKDFGTDHEVLRWIGHNPFDGRLYVSTRATASLWSSADGIDFVNHGSPDGVGAQIKSFTFVDGEVFLGTVSRPPGVFRFSAERGDFIEVARFPGQVREVYHPDVCGDHAYFALRVGGNGAPIGGAVYQCGTDGCIAVNYDQASSGPFHSIVTSSDGHLYLGTGPGGQIGSRSPKLRAARCFRN
jgi:hypothetical protein